jgi:hypothetical protein
MRETQEDATAVTLRVRRLLQALEQAGGKRDLLDVLVDAGFVPVLMRDVDRLLEYQRRINGMYATLFKERRADWQPALLEREAV